MRAMPRRGRGQVSTQISWSTSSLPLNLNTHSNNSTVPLFQLLLFWNCCTIQIFSSNLSNPISRGGINWSLCRSKSLGNSHSTHRQNDISSSSTAGLYILYILYISIYRCDVCRYVALNISIRYGNEWVTFFCSYVFCHKMVNNGRILVFEVSIEPY